MQRMRHDVAAFCDRHNLVLDTPKDWRVMSTEHRWTHFMFGDIVEGITDGVVCWCLMQSGLTAFVHLDLCHSEKLPNLTFGRCLVPEANKTLVAKATTPRKRQSLLARLLDEVSY